MPVKIADKDENMRIEHRRSRNLHGTFAAVCAVAVSAGAIMISTAEGEPSERAVSHEDNRGIAAAVQPDQAEGFAVFAGERRPEDVMSADARHQVGSSPHSGRNADLSRAIRTPTGRGWAVPGNGTICVVMPDPVDGFGVACTETSVARRTGVVVMMIGPDNPSVTQVTLITPRGARVEAREAGGRARALRADEDGIVSASLRGVGELLLTTSAGTHSLPLPAAPPRPPRG